MGTVQASRLVSAPVEAVWNCLNDIAHTPDWVTGLAAAEVVTPDPFGLGSAYVDHNRLGPFPQATRWHVTVFEPMSRQVHVSDSAVLPSTMTLSLSPAPEGTLLTMGVEYRFLPWLGGFSRLLESVLMNRLLAQVLRENEASLEAYLSKH